MQVTVEDGYIADITVLSFRDDQEFFHKAQSAVINAILTEQTTDVSTVNGATFSSSSIMDAVADALGASPERTEQPAGGESGSGAEEPEAGGGNGHGFGQHGAGGREGGWRRGFGKGWRGGRRK